MERKDYAQKFHDIKNDILLEIRSLVPEDTAHHFSEKFYVHYVEGEVATTEICTAVEVWCGGMVVFIVHRDTTAKDEVIEGESVFMYDPDSFLDILDHLKKDLREKKLAYIRDIVKKHNGRIEFDNKFRFTGFDGDSECEFVGLLSLSLKEDGKLNIEDEWQDGIYDNSENFIPDSELDRFIEYVKEKTMKKFSIYVHGCFGRVFDDIEADSYEDALAIAKKMWEEKPLNKEDSDGENWEPWKS